jgi:cardiolipin synthase
MRTLLVVVTFIAVACIGCANGTDHPYRIRHEYSVADPQFRRSIGSLLGPPIIDGNATTALVNGDQIFPAMLDAIRSAKKTINFESYVFWSGKVGDQFSSALSDAARRGVKVHVMMDSIGSARIAPKYVSEMKKAGVQIVKYHPLHWFALTFFQERNNRTHRKLLVCDGVVGFTGGAGIADEWSGNADSAKHWRDTHYLIKGPVVADLQAAFLDNWMETTGDVLHGPDYFPELKKEGEQSAQVFKSSPDNGSESMELMYLMSMAAAEKNIRLASAYFVPDHLAEQTMIDARKRGVRVQIIVPGKHIDEKIVRPASRARWGELLKAGVEIYEFEPTMYHVKQMIVDDRWVSIGSANLDNLSFKLNDEANLNVMDEKFAAEQIKLFEEDLKRSKQMSYEQWQDRSFHQKLTDALATMFGFTL